VTNRMGISVSLLNIVKLHFAKSLLVAPCLMLVLLSTTASL
jgi:hypothetical protein